VRDGKPLWLPSYEEVSTDLQAFSEMSGHFQNETNPGNGARCSSRTATRRCTSTRRPSRSTRRLMDELYDLPFQRAPHFGYTEKIPAFETVKHSIVTMRGCFGGCSFCSITEHEGRSSRAAAPRACCARCARCAAWATSRRDQRRRRAHRQHVPDEVREETIERSCRRLSCVHPKVCENLVTDHQPLIQLLKKVREEDGVKKVFIASGVRYDLAERSPEFIASWPSTTRAGSSRWRPSTWTTTCSTR
jgi:hypothetical protein